MITLNSSIVSVEWLHKHLGATNLVVLDASMKKVTDHSNKTKSNQQILTSRYFDIKINLVMVMGVFRIHIHLWINLNVRLKI